MGLNGPALFILPSPFLLKLFRTIVMCNGVAARIENQFLSNRLASERVVIHHEGTMEEIEFFFGSRCT